MDEYFDFLDNASVGKFYDWSSLHIDLNFDKSEVDLDNILTGTKQFGNTHNEALFIHEYVHFLQNFYTNWGALVFCEYVLGLEKIGASVLQGPKELSLPLKLSPAENMPLWNKGIEHYNKFGSMLSTDDGKIQLVRLNPYPNYSIVTAEDAKLKLNNGLITYEISNKTIREHMAELSSMLFLNYSDDEIHNRFLNSNALCSSKGMLDKSPMYWMVFEYFYFHKSLKIAEGLVALMHGALCSASPVTVICRFFKHIKEFDIPIQADLTQIVSGFFNTPVEAVSFSYCYFSAVRATVKQFELSTKHYDHHFYKFNVPIFATLMTNIKDTYSGKLIFGNPTQLREKGFWANLIKNTGTPIVRYKDKTPVATNSNDKLIESLKYFLGVTKTLRNLQSSTEYACPFHTEFNICKASYRNNDQCLHDPVSVINKSPKDGECHFRNSMILLGLDKRIK